MTDHEYASKILNAISAKMPLDAPEFEVNRKTGRNVARLITTSLWTRLPNAMDKNRQRRTVKWEGGVVVFKNYTRDANFWTKVTLDDLDRSDGLRAWVCSSVDRQRALLNVWVIPFSMIREQFGRLPEDQDLSGDRNLKIVKWQDGWSFRFQDGKGSANPPQLANLHHEFDLRKLDQFQQACDADAAKGNVHDASRPIEGQSTNAQDQDRSSEGKVEVEGEKPGSNRILFGPPGTGKSRLLHDELKADHTHGRARRVTFHPEYSYADFVGSYKPTMAFVGQEQYHDASGKPIEIDGRPAVVYKFVAGPLIQMICKAMLKPSDHFYLIIEEINRGNCAAIFGDLFQLLDRQEGGESEYAVWVEEDLRTCVQQHLVDSIDNDAKQRLETEGLFIPSNLSIYATMNTSDQSLYPMDSAMKRRWEMRYVPIDYTKAEGRKVNIRGYAHAMDWGDVLFRINKEVVRYTHSDDKQIGQWFVNGQTINEETFRDKVLSYLWFDVFRQNPQDLFDLGDSPYCYETLVRRYNSNEKIFKRGVLED